MHVTVEDGKAVALAGDPDHPITVGFLCGKVSNYLERVYAGDRILHPLVRSGAKGEGGFERVSWDDALERVAAGLLRVRKEHGGEAILPYSYMGTRGMIQGNIMSARVMNALGATELERTICATAGMAGTVPVHGLSPEVDPEEWPHARYVLVWGWNPMSTAPHLWRKLLDARKAGAALIDDELDPPVKALVCWNSNPAAIAPDQEQVLAGLRRDDLFTVVLEQFMTDTALHADVVLPATTQLEHLDVLFSWGHHYLTWNEPAIAPVGEAKPNTETFRLLAARLGLDDPVFRETDQELADELLADFDEDGLRERGWTKIDLGQGPAPHADGGFATESGKLVLRADYVRPGEVADVALGERFPLALVTPKTHLFLNSTFANQRRQHSAQPHPEVVVSPADASARGIGDGSVVRVWNDRGEFSCTARVSDDARPGVLVAPMGWWNRDYAAGRSAQATTSQRLTEIGNAPTFNDNRVEIEPLSG